MNFVHILDQCSQDWFAVLSVIENLLDEIVQTTPEIKQIFLRSDNAGCYHNGQLLISLPTIVKQKGLVLKNYSFSVSNSGKDVCDIKAHVARYLNEGNQMQCYSWPILPYYFSNHSVPPPPPPPHFPKATISQQQLSCKKP